MRNDKEDTILRSDAIEAVYRACQRPLDDEVFIRIREELKRVPRTSMATIQANVEVDMDELVKRVTEEIRNSFILDPAGWIPCNEKLPNEEGTYLVTYEWVGKTGTKYIEVEGIDFEHGRWGCHDYEKVTAWRPLPKPWKGADDEEVDVL